MICHVEDLGLVEYQKAYSYQKSKVSQVSADGKPVLLLCEHPPVITFGRLAKEENVLVSRGVLEGRGVRIFSIDRGGDVTLHVPGQLVVYPIIPLIYWKKDLHWYLNQLEQVAIDLLKSFDIVANRISGKTGVWVNGSKIVSIGVGVRQWVTYHGFSINVDPDMAFFDLINPCGLNALMTSMAKIKGMSVDIQDIKDHLIECFSRQFHVSLDKTNELNILYNQRIPL